MVQTVIKTGFLCTVRDESEDYLIIDRMVAGVKVARLPDRPAYGTWEPVVLMKTRKFERAAPARVKADAEHRGGSTRSSVETPVMRRGAKGLGYSAIEYDQPLREES
jgi:hypothetical protein